MVKRNAIRFTLTVLTAITLAGCFTSKASLYEGVTPLQPFRDSAVFTESRQGKAEHFAVHQASSGVYKFTSEGPRKDRDLEKEEYRFFPLPGVPGDTMVAEVKVVDDAKVGDPCLSGGAPDQKTCTVYLYNLWRRTSKGIETTNPDCSKVKGVANLPDVSVSGDKTSCNFTRRLTLERALRMAVSAHLQPDDSFTFGK